MLFTLSDTGMYVDGGDWSIMVFKRSLHSAALSGILALIDVKVFRAYIEILLLSLGEVEAVGVDLLLLVALCPANCRLIGRYLGWVLVILCCSQEIKVLGIYEYSWSPITQLAIITDTDDCVSILVTNN